MRAKSLVQLGMGVLFFFQLGCDKCEGEEPYYKFENTGTSTANIRVLFSDGTEDAITGISGGIETEWFRFGKGEITFVITFEGLSGSRTETVEGKSCRDYVVRFSDEERLDVGTDT